MQLENRKRKHSNITCNGKGGSSILFCVCVCVCYLLGTYADWHIVGTSSHYGDQRSNEAKSHFWGPSEVKGRTILWADIGPSRISWYWCVCWCFCNITYCRKRCLLNFWLLHLRWSLSIWTIKFILNLWIKITCHHYIITCAKKQPRLYLWLNMSQTFV